MQKFEDSANASQAGAAAQPVNGKGGDDQVKSQQISDKNKFAITELEKIKKFFEQDPDRRATEALEIVLKDGCPVMSTLFDNYSNFSVYPMDLFELLLRINELGLEEEAYDPNIHNCGEGQFEMRKILCALWAEKISIGVNNIFSRVGCFDGPIVSFEYYDYFKCSHAASAIENIIQELKDNTIEILDYEDIKRMRAEEANKNNRKD